MLLLHHARIVADGFGNRRREKRDAENPGPWLRGEIFLNHEIHQTHERNVKNGVGFVLTFVWFAYFVVASICNWRTRWDLHPHSSRRQRVAFLFSYESKGMAGERRRVTDPRAVHSKWREALVTLQSSLPVRFATPVLQTGNRIASPSLKVGSGGGSRAHGG